MSNEVDKLEESKQNLNTTRAEYESILAQKKEVFAETLAVMTAIDKEMKLVKVADAELNNSKLKHKQVQSNHEKYVATLTEINTNTDNIQTESNRIAANITANKSILDEKKQQLDIIKGEQAQVLSETAKLAKDILVVKEQIDREKNESKNLNKNIVALNAQIDILQRTRTMENSKLLELTKTVDEQVRKIEDIKQSKNIMENTLIQHKKVVEGDTATLIVLKKEYDVVVSEKNKLKEKNESSKGLLTAERVQLKAAEKSLSDIDKVLEKERKTFQDLKVQMQKKTDIITAGKSAIEDTKSKITAIEETAAKQGILMKDTNDHLNAANAALVAVKKEYDGAISSKDELIKKIEHTKSLIATERSQITNAEISLTDITKSLDKDKRTIQTLTTQFQKKTEVLSAGKSTLEDLTSKIATLEEASEKQGILIKENTDKFKEANATLVTLKKEYDDIVSTKDTLNGKIASTKDQIKISENSLADLNLSIEKDKKILQDLTMQFNKKTDILGAGKNTIEDITTKIAIVDEETVKQRQIIKDHTDTSAALKKEYDQVVVSKNALITQIASIKELLVNERSQIKISENSLVDINLTVEKDKKTLYDLNTTLQKKTTVMNTGKNALQDVAEKIVAIEAASVKQGLLIKETTDKMNAANAALVALNKEYNDVVSSKNEINGNITERKTRLSNEQAQAKAAATSLADINKALDKDNKVLQDLTTQFQKKSAMLQTGKNTIKDIETKLAALEEESAAQDLIIKDNTAKLNAAKIERDKHKESTNTALAVINKEYTELVTVKTELIAKLANEQAQLKGINNSIADINALIEKDIKTKSELNIKLKKNTTALHTGNKTIQDIADKIKSLEEDSVKQVRAIKENIDKMNATKLERDKILETNNAELAVVKKEYDDFVTIKDGLNAKITATRAQVANEKTRITAAENAISNVNLLLEKEKKSAHDLDVILRKKMEQIDAGKRQIEGIKSKIRDIEEDSVKQENTIKKNMDNLNASKLETTKHIEAINAEIALVKKEHENLVSVKNKNIEKRDSLKGMLTTEQAQIKLTENTISEINILIEKEKKTLNQLNTTLMKKTEQLNTGKKALEDIASKVTAIEEDSIKQTHMIKENLDAMNAAKMEKDVALALVKKEYDDVVSAKNTVSAQITSTKGLLAYERAQIKIIEKSITDTDTLLEKDKKVLQDLNTMLEKKTDAQNTNRNTIDEITSKITSIEEDSLKQRSIIKEKKEKMDLAKIEQTKSVDILNTELTLVKKEIDDLVASKNNINEKLASTKGLITTERAQIKTVEKSLSDTNILLEKDKKALQDLNINLQKRTDAHSKNQNTIDELTSKITSIEEDSIKQGLIIKEKINKIDLAKIEQTKNLNILDTALGELKKEHDMLVSSKTELNGIIESTKGQIVHERAQIKLIESSLSDINISYEKDKKTLQDLNNTLQKKNDANNIGKNTINDTTLKIKALEEDAAKQELMIKENVEKMNAVKIERDAKIIEKSESEKALVEIKSTLAQQLESLKTAEKEFADTTGRKKQLEIKYNDLSRNLQSLIASEANFTNHILTSTNKIATVKENIEKQKVIIEERNKQLSIINEEFSKDELVKNTIVNKLDSIKDELKQVLLETKSSQIAISDIDTRIKSTKILNKELLDALSIKNKLLESEIKSNDLVKKDIDNITITIAKNNDELNQTTQQLRNISSEHNQILINKNILDNKLLEIKRIFMIDSDITKKHEKELTHANKKLEEINIKKNELAATLENVHKSIAHMIEETKRISNDIASQDSIITETDNALGQTKEKSEKSALLVSSKKQELKDVLSNIATDTENVQNLEKEISKMMGQHDIIIKKYTKMQSSVGDIQTSINKNNKQIEEIAVHKEDILKQDAAVKALVDEAQADLNIVKIEHNALLMSKKIINSTLAEAKAKMSAEIAKIAAIEKSIEETNAQIEFENKHYNDISQKYAMKLKVFDSGRRKMNDTINSMTILEKEISKQTVTNDQPVSAFIEHVETQVEEVHKGEEIDTNSDVKIYILCHNQQCFNEAPAIYGKYSWAVPILMKYQDITFENAFWKQLFEIRADWYNCKMVGTLSFKASKKLNLSIVDNIIRDPTKWTTGYYHFLNKDTPINNRQHPNLVNILLEVTKTLRLEMPNENCCNYWMCVPDKMLRFLIWFEEDAHPVVMAHPLSMTDSKYIGSLKRDDLLKLGQYPFYTHAPFVFERLFMSYFKKIARIAN